MTDTTKATPTQQAQQAANAAAELAATAMEGVERHEKDLMALRQELEQANLSQTERDGLMARMEELERRAAEQAASVDHGPALADVKRQLTALADEFDAKLTSLQQSNLVGDQLASDLEQVSTRVKNVELGFKHAVAANGQPVPGVYGKILAVMRAVTAISKDREVKAEGKGPRYKFRGIDDAMEAVGHAQRDVGLLILPYKITDREIHRDQVTSNSGFTTTWTTVHFLATFQFVDPDDGSTAYVTMAGEGRDNSDKATSKAESMALKYALLQGFMIPTNDEDPEETRPEVTRPPAQQSPPAAPVRSPEEKVRDGLAALRAVPTLRHEDGTTFTSAEQKEHIEKIKAYAMETNLLNEVVEGGRFSMWIASALSTFEEAATSGDPWGSDGGY